MRFWDIASGEEVRQVVLSDFAFVSKAEICKLTTNHHFIKAEDSTLEISELLPHGGTEDIEGG